GIEPGRFHRGIDSEEKAYAAGHRDGQNNRPDRHRRWEMRQLQQEAEDQRQDDAQNAANASERRGFSDELEADVAFARPNGLTHADFTGSFRDGHEHYVHHPNAPDQQTDRDDPHNELEDPGHDVAELHAKLLRAADAEIVGFVRWDAPAHAQKAADLVLGHAFHAGARLGDEDNLVILGIVFLVGAEGNENLHVAGLVKRALLLVKYADHGVKIAVHQQLLAFGIFVGKEALFGVIADDHDVFAVQVLKIGIEAAFFHLAVDHLRLGRRHSAKKDVGELVVLVAGRTNGLWTRPDAGQNFNDHLFYRRQFLPDRDAVFVGQDLARALFGGEPAKADSRLEFQDKQI